MEKPGQVKWYFKNGSLLIAFLIVGPFVLPLIWANPRFDKKKKIIISAIVMIASILLIAMTAGSLKALIDSYQEMLKVW